MAGIGFELRKVLKRDRLSSLVEAYSYAAMLSSGPWVISILAVILVGFISLSNYIDPLVSSFQIIVTYVIAVASSLIVTGVLQLPYTRYVADLIFKNKEEEILPSYFGSILLSWILGIPFILIVVFWAFPEENYLFKFIVSSTFLVLCAVWISSILAASLKLYKTAVLAYFLSYLFIVIASYFFGTTIEALLYIFLLGNSILLIILMTLIIKRYDSKHFISISFFKEKDFYWTLAIAGLTYNFGSWIDKFIFWYHPLTGVDVIGKLHASYVYDIPIFIAYLSIIPGMAVFFYRLEVDFAQKYDLYYNTVRESGTLELIQKYRNEMVFVIRHALFEIIIIQGILDIFMFLTVDKIFALLDIPQLYAGLLFILAIGAMIQLAFMSVLALLYYLDRKKVAMWLCIAFFVLNGLLTLVSIDMGPYFYGYGYAVSLLLVFTASLVIIRNQMENLDYETFMLQ
jgi:uncharacterized membrane protein